MTPANFAYRAPNESSTVSVVVRTSAGTATKRITSTVASHLEALYSLINAATAQHIARVAYLVTEGGVSEVDRIVLLQRYRRAGQRELSRDVHSAPSSRACVLLECEGGVHCFYLNLAACRGVFDGL